MPKQHSHLKDQFIQQVLQSALALLQAKCTLKEHKHTVGQIKKQIEKSSLGVNEVGPILQAAQTKLLSHLPKHELKGLKKSALGDQVGARKFPSQLHLGASADDVQHWVGRHAKGDKLRHLSGEAVDIIKQWAERRAETVAPDNQELYQVAVKYVREQINARTGLDGLMMVLKYLETGKRNDLDLTRVSSKSRFHKASTQVMRKADQELSDMLANPKVQARIKASMQKRKEKVAKRQAQFKGDSQGGHHSNRHRAGHEKASVRKGALRKTNK